MRKLSAPAILLQPAVRLVRNGPLDQAGAQGRIQVNLAEVLTIGQSQSPHQFAARESFPEIQYLHQGFDLRGDLRGDLTEKCHLNTTGPFLKGGFSQSRLRATGQNLVDPAPPGLYEPALKKTSALCGLRGLDAK